MSPTDLVPGSRVRATHRHTVLGIVGPSLMLPVTSVGTRFYMVGFFPWRVVAGNLGATPPTFGDVIVWLQSCRRPNPAIFIAETPPTLSRRVYMALIGGGIHEALHRLLTCQRTLSPREVMELVIPRFGDVNWLHYRKLLLDLNNILEDIWIERIGNALFPGIHNKLADLGDFILDMEAPVRKKELNLPEPPTSRILFATIRELGLGYNTEKSRAAIAHYKLVDPGAVRLLTQGGLADIWSRMVPDVSTPRAVEQARMDLDRGITLSLAMDVIRVLIELGKVKPPPPAPPKPPPQDGEPGEDGSPGGDPEESEDEGSPPGDAPEPPPEEGEPEDEPGDPPTGGEAPESDPESDPEAGEDDGGTTGGDPDDEENDEDDEENGSGSGEPSDDEDEDPEDPEGSFGAPEEDPEEGDPEGKSEEGDPEEDPKGSPKDGNKGKPPEENGTEEEGQNQVPTEDPEGDNVGGTGAGGPGAAEDAKTLEQFLADHEANGAGLKDASAALEEAIIKELQAELQAQPVGEKPYRAFTTAADEVLDIPRVPDFAAAAFRAAVAPTRQITAYLRTHLSRWFQGLEQGGREHGLQRGSGLSDRMLVDTFGSLREGRDPRRAFYQEEEEMDMSLAVAVVIDQSGSMEGKQKETGGLAYALGAAFEQMRARSMIVGFRSVGDKEKERLVIPAEVMAQTPNHGYHRVHLVRYDMFKRWNEEFRIVSNRLSQLRADGHTPMADGIEFALQELSQRKEAFRFLIVLTDGAPNGGTEPVIRGQVRRATEAGIGILGVGVGGSDGSYVKIFKDFVHREKLEDLPPPLIRKFMDMLRVSVSKRGRTVRA